MNIELNILELLIAGVVSMALGFLWYGPLLGKVWMDLKGYTKKSMEEAKKDMGKLYGLSFLGSLIMAYVLSHVMAMSTAFFGSAPLMTALNTAFWMWLGFVMPVQMTATIFGEKKWKLFAIDTGYQLVSILGMALAITFV